MRIKVNNIIRDLSIEDGDLLIQSCLLNRIPFEVISYL